jgi:hypothetical protein
MMEIGRRKRMSEERIFSLLMKCLFVCIDVDVNAARSIKNTLRVETRRGEDRRKLDGVIKTYVI